MSRPSSVRAQRAGGRSLALRAIVLLLIALAFGSSAAAPTGTVVRVEHRDPSTAPTRGPKHALVTIELFFAPNSSLGARLPALRSLERLQANHPTRIRLVYRMVKRTGMQLVAIAALEAHTQGKFDEFITELHLDRATAMLHKDKILEIAKRADLDLARMATVLSDGPYNEARDRHNETLNMNDRRLSRMLHVDNPPQPNVLFNSSTIRASLGAPSDTDLEREYVTAYERALDMLDRGVPGDRLMEAFDQHAQRRDQPYVMSRGGDENDDDPSGDHKLAKPPLDLRGLPSYGKPGGAAMPVVLLCRPNDQSCLVTLNVGRKLQQIYSNDIRVVWAPWFDVTRDDNTDLALLADVVLCAEQVGSSPDDLDESPGWAWITRQLEVVTRPNQRRAPVETLINIVTTDLKVDSGRLSACRARMANTSLDWIAKARRSGVTRSPAVIVGGRIYEGLNESTTIQQLIESELAPGVLARCSTIGCSSE